MSPPDELPIGAGNVGHTNPSGRADPVLVIALAPMSGVIAVSAADGPVATYELPPYGQYAFAVPKSRIIQRVTRKTLFTIGVDSGLLIILRYT